MLRYTCCLLCILLIFVPTNIFADTTIISKPTSTKEQCKQWMIDNDVEQEFIDLIPYIYDRCTEIGINPTIVVCQSALETGYFTSYTLRTFHNTAGIKDRKNENKYAYYETYKEGFDAQICHLALYAGIPQKDYYYSSRLDGWVPTVEGLSGTWAEDPYYSNKIIRMMSTVAKYDVKTDGKTDGDVLDKEQITESTVKTNNSVDIIKNIINKKRSNHKTVEFLKSFIKH